MQLQRLFAPLRFSLWFCASKTTLLVALAILRRTVLMSSASDGTVGGGKCWRRRTSFTCSHGHGTP